jgi:hypothetical protein
VSLPRQSSLFDEHRNSSRVFPVTAQDAENARRALARFAQDDPLLYAWVAEGAPRLSEAEHLARFGEPYRGVKARKRT